MAAVLSIPERQVVLTGISWETYRRLLSEREEQSGLHFTYDRGTLEIMVLSARHEEPNRALAALVEVLAEELHVDIRRLGSTTFQREDLARGFEADSCFYVQHVDAVAGKDEIDLGIDPAPDLVIEVDIASASINKLPIFAAVRIPEVWRYDGTRVHLLCLEGGRYRETTVSLVLPPLTGEIATRFLDDARRLKSTEWLGRVRAWVRGLTA